MPCLLEVPSLGFGYPFDGVSHLKTLGASFSSQRSWAFPFEAFLRQLIEILFPKSPPFLRFLNKPSGLLMTLQRFYPNLPAVPLVAPEGLVRVGAHASLGFRSLRLPPILSCPPVSLCLDSLLVLWAPKSYLFFAPELQGIALKVSGISLIKRAPAHLTFLADCPLRPF